MVNGKSFYFQNLLLKIFLENKVDRLKNITLYKNILNSRINKCLLLMNNNKYGLNTSTNFFFGNVEDILICFL